MSAASARADGGSVGGSGESHQQRVPRQYHRVVSMLREVALRPPPTPPVLARSLVGCGMPTSGGCAFTFVHPDEYHRGQGRGGGMGGARGGGRGRGRGGARGGGARRRRRGIPPPNELYPELAAAVFELERAIGPAGRSPSSRCLVLVNAELTPVALGGDGAGAVGDAMVVRLGRRAEHGRASPAFVDGAPVGKDHVPAVFDSASTFWTYLPTDSASTPPTPHSAPHSAENDLFTLIWFARDHPCEAPRPMADTAAALASALSPPLRYRPGSTDANVIVEILGRGAYSGPKPLGDPRWPADVDWSPCGHRVLDVGAHVGCFSRLCLDAGAASVVAIEPEPANAELCRRNCGIEAAAEQRNTATQRDAAAAATGRGAPRATVFELAVAHGAAASGEARALVLGRERSDGVTNTWRHALDGLSHYKATGSGGGDGSAGGRDDTGLQMVGVQAVPLLGSGGLLSPDVSFVKMDCEGAELDVLSNFHPGEWLNVRRLVFEYSFTKRPEISSFVDVVEKLEKEGFEVAYEGKGNWERSLERWPWQVDALVYAWR